MQAAAVIGICAIVAGCVSTPTVEELNAKQAKYASECQSKGYKPGTQDFHMCTSLALQSEAAKPMNDGAAVMGGLTAASIGLSLLALSDLRAKTDIAPLATLESGIHLYRFRYLGSDQLYVGVIAQDVQRVRPEAVIQGSDGFLRVRYDLVGTRLVRWEEWNALPAQGL